MYYNHSLGDDEILLNRIPVTTTISSTYSIYVCWRNTGKSINFKLPLSIEFADTCAKQASGQLFFQLISCLPKSWYHQLEETISERERVIDVPFLLESVCSHILDFRKLTFKTSDLVHFKKCSKVTELKSVLNLEVLEDLSHKPLICGV